MRNISRLNGVPLFMAGYERVVNYKAPEKFYIYQGSSIVRKYDKRPNASAGVPGDGEVNSKSAATPFYELYEPKADTRRNEPGGLDAKKSKPDRIHVLSYHSANKVREKLTAFFDAVGGHKTLVTLTFISAVTDETAMMCLNKFLTVLRKDYNKRIEYLWVAERQENGNIHFHMFCNRRLHLFRYLKLWVTQQYNAGIKHEKYTRSDVDGWTNIKDAGLHASFDVKKVKTIDGIAWYLTKYVVKERISKDEKQKLVQSGEIKKRGYTCRPWHCTRNVSRLFTRAAITRDCWNDYDSSRNRSIDKETGEVFERVKIKNDYATVIYIRNKQQFKKNLAKMREYNKFIIGGGVLDGEQFAINKQDYWKHYVYRYAKTENTQLKGSGLHEVSANQLQYREAVEKARPCSVEPENNYAGLVSAVVRNRILRGESIEGVGVPRQSFYARENGSKWLKVAHNGSCDF